MHGDHGPGVGTGTTPNIPWGAGAVAFVFWSVRGVGVENDANEFSVTDSPGIVPTALVNSLPRSQVLPLPPMNIPIPPSTRNRTGTGKVGGAFCCGFHS